MKKPQESRSSFVKTHHYVSQLLKSKVIQIRSGHLHIYMYLGLPDPEDKGTMNLQDVRNNLPKQQSLISCKIEPGGGGQNFHV